MKFEWYEHMKKTIIFDFDGTIANTLPVILHIANVLAKEHGFKQINNHELHLLQNKTAKELLKLFGIPLLKLPVLMLRGQTIMKEHMKEIELFPHMKIVLEALQKQGYILGILSTNSKENVEFFLKKNQLDMFSFIHSELNLFGKSGALDKMLKKYKLHKPDVLYVGDEVRDIEACKKVGVDIVSVTWGFNSREVLEKYQPNKLVGTPEELLQCIRKQL
jgi:phosphoglycolate phosphatase-like HAD superfamily hydrolase